MTSTKRKMLLPILMVSALLASACGGDDDSDSSSGSTDAPGATDAPSSGAEGTLRVLVHQNPPMVAFMEEFNDKFEADNPGVTIDLSVVNADDLATVNQTRLTANDIDVTTITVTGFANPVQPYMTDAVTPYWQQLIEAGQLMDLSDQPFVKNYDELAIKEGGSFDGKVYSLNLGRTTYSGMFVNLDLLAEVGVEVPTTWDELVAACDAVEGAGYKCMIAGGADGWPVFVGSYGLLGALYPDQQGLVEGLWTGGAKWNDEQGLQLFERYQTFASMLDAESAGLGGDAAAQRYLAGDIAFGPMGGWNAGVMEPPADSDQPGAEFEWSYVPFPGSDDAADNQTLFGKYDQGWAVAANTPVKDLAMAYLAAFSEPDNYNAFANAVNFLPTQPTATLDSIMGRSVAPILQAGNFTVGFEQWFVGPQGAGQFANGAQAALWFYNGDFADPVEAADTAQADLESGL
jgi:raffinose/stachyose/melibiose transport system substrate-binding protein